MQLLLLFLAARAFAKDPELRTGDLVFQTSQSSQANAIMGASNSLYSHVGILEVDESGARSVVEAIGKVSRTPFASWVKRGRNGYYSVFRLRDGGAADGQKIAKAADEYLGRSYDIYFSSDNREIYCSELVALAFQDAGKSIGKYQAIKTLNVDTPAVRTLVEQRWRGHPACRQVKEFPECWKRILETKLITPVSIANDSRLELIFTNYAR